MTTKIVTSAALGCVIALSGCGGGSNASEQTKMTGQFLDSAVQGLGYRCSSDGNGTTGANGDFTCNTGDTVTFNINGFEIGSVRAGAFITPKTLYPNDAAKATDVAQLLQTLDSDGNPNNGITIDSHSQSYQALSGAEVALGQADFDTAMASYIGIALVDETTADAHMALTVRNVENGAGTVNENSVVVVMNGVSESVCRTQDPYTQRYEGYTDFADFLNAGGSVGLNYYSGPKRCNEYASAAFCQEQDFADTPGGVSGTGSCVQVVTLPDKPASDGNSTGDDTTGEEPVETDYLMFETYSSDFKPLLISLAENTLLFQYLDYANSKVTEMGQLYGTMEITQRIADTLYSIGGNQSINAYDYTVFQFAQTTLTQTSYSSNYDGVLNSGSSDITQSGYGIKYDHTTNRAQFSLPIDAATLKNMYAEMGADINFNGEDAGQFFAKNEGGLSYYMTLLLNESAFQKVMAFLSQKQSMSDK